MRNLILLFSRKRARLIVFALLIGGAAAVYAYSASADAVRRIANCNGRRTVADVLRQHLEPARAKFQSICRQRGLAWPPVRMQLLAFKEEAILEIWGANSQGPFRLL